MVRLRSIVPLIVFACAATRAGETDRLGAWAREAILGEAAPEVPAPIGLDVRRQDHGTFRINRSVLDTPLRIGAKSYAHGLGTHSVSEIIVRLPRPGRAFEADAGIDNNHDTAAQRGSVIFAIDIGGKEAFRSGIRRGSNVPLAVRVDLAGAREFALRVLDAGDGPGWDQSDWADPTVTLDDGARIRLDEMPVILPPAKLAAGPPFSFIYGGKPSAEILGAWKRTCAAGVAAGGRLPHTATFIDPATGLEIACEVTLFDGFDAAEWVLRIRNTGRADSPILEKILPLDLALAAPGQDIRLHRAHGSTCTPTDFLPIEEAVAPGAGIRVAPKGGRSSDGALPFFRIAWPGGGLIGAIGWSGQWALEVARDAGTGLRLRAGQEETHLLLHPGEAIRTPRILLVSADDEDPMAGHLGLRRLLLTHYVPRRDGEIVLPPVTQNEWFTYNSGNEVTEANQLEAIARMAPIGVEAYWLDAGWFEGGWPSGVGSWFPKTDAFPRGLRPLGDAALARGMGFVVWFEPERVHPASRIAKEHPEWVLRAGAGDGLFALGDPAARAWLTDLLSKHIADWGITIFRQDFNIDPLRFWRAADPPDRNGIAEIRHVEGLYALWDALRERHPRLSIDDCASGGRRIDLETISRSFPLWRSDTQCCGRAMPVQDQVQTAGLSLWVPLHSAGVWSFDPYAFRSVATTGTNLCMDARGPEFPAHLARLAIDEARSLRPLWLGDYRPLLPIDLDETHWCGWQLDRQDIGRGAALLFRRSKSPYAAVDIALVGPDPRAEYEVTFAQRYDERTRRTMRGGDLARLRVEIADAPGSLIVEYRKRGPADAALDRARAGVEAHRKGEFAVRILGSDGAPLRDADAEIALVRHAFLFGSNIYAFGTFKDPAEERIYRERFAEIFNSATLPFYWRSYEPERDAPRYASTDAILDWCMPRGIACKGHPLVWTHPAGIPKWLDEKDAAATRERILGRVRDIARRYTGRIARWEVVNEAAHTRAFAGLGDPISQIVATYQTARDADPKAELILNEYDVMSGRLNLRAFAEKAIAAGAPIDGIGVQAHEPLVPAFEPGEMVRILDDLAKLGKPIHLTELAFTSDGRPVKRRGSDGAWRDTGDRWTEAFQADYVELFYRIAFAHPAVVSITWWDLADGRSWQEGGGLLRRNLSTKPAYERLRQLIREEWTTRVQAKTDRDGIVRLRGFFGIYRVQAEGLEAAVDLARGAEGPVTARLEAPGR